MSVGKVAKQARAHNLILSTWANPQWVGQEGGFDPMYGFGIAANEM
jgi:hypothetical protein